MNKLIAFFSLVLLFSACSNKEQKLINNLDGEWKITSFKTNNVAIPEADFAGVYFEFLACKSKEFDFCDGIYTRTDSNSVTTNFSYSIGEDAETFTFDFVSPDMQDISGAISKDSKTKFTFKYTDVRGDSQEFVLEPK